MHWNLEALASRFRIPIRDKNELRKEISNPCRDKVEKVNS